MVSKPAANRVRGLPVTEPLTASEIAAIVSQLSQEFGWEGDWRTPTIERVWSTGYTGNRFALLRRPESVDRVVIKVLGERDTDGTEPGALLASRMDGLADLLAARCPEAAMAPRQIGWLDAPPVVATPYVVGSRLKESMDRLDDTAVVGWIRSAGTALAAYHDGGPTGCATEATALTQLRRTTDRFPLSEAARQALTGYARQPGVLAPRFQDFSLRNVIGKDGGAIAVLDPPIELELAPRHSDVARFLFHIRRTLAGMDRDTVRRAGSLRTRMQQEFLTSYQRHADIDIESAHGDAMLTMYEATEAFGMAWRKIRRLARSRSLSWQWASVAWGAALGVSAGSTLRKKLR